MRKATTYGAIAALLVRVRAARSRLRQQQQVELRLGHDREGGSNGQTPSSGKLQGGTAHFNLNTDTDYVDPALAYYQRLVAVRVRDVREAPQLPGHARGTRARSSCPRSPSACRRSRTDGKTYTFTVRDGFKFSPPSNEPVTAKTFKFVIDRVLNPKMQSPARSSLGDIVGAEAVHRRHGEDRPRRQGRRQQADDHADEDGARLPVADRDAVLLRGPENTPIDPNGVQTRRRRRPVLHQVVDAEAAARAASATRTTRATARTTSTGSSTRSVIARGDAARRSRRARPTMPPTAFRRPRTRSSARSTARGARPRRTASSSTSSTRSLSFRYLALNTSRPHLRRTSSCARPCNYAIDRHGAARASVAPTPAPDGRSTCRRASSATSDEQHLPARTRPTSQKAKQLAGSGSTRRPSCTPATVARAPSRRRSCSRT